jgi:hypothetical protein
VVAPAGGVVAAAVGDVAAAVLALPEVPPHPENANAIAIVAAIRSTVLPIIRFIYCLVCLLNCQTDVPVVCPRRAAGRVVSSCSAQLSARSETGLTV